jgi:exodeoxyribonuclease VIII
MKYPHATTDLETMGNTTTAAIVAIGCVAFSDEHNGTAEFYRLVDLESSLDAGLTVTASTITWWLSQSDEARQDLTNRNHEALEPLYAALTGWSKFLTQHTTVVEGRYVSNRFHHWTHATFDAPILTHAWSRVFNESRTPPIPYKCQRDIRTLDMLCPIEYPKRSNIHHNALDDARYQAVYIRNTLRRFEQMKQGIPT